MKRILPNSIGIVIGTVMVISKFNSPPPTPTGNDAFDEGAQMGGWTFLAMGIAVIVYNVVRIFQKRQPADFTEGKTEGE